MACLAVTIRQFDIMSGGSMARVLVQYGHHVLYNTVSQARHCTVEAPGEMCFRWSGWILETPLQVKGKWTR